jgi:septal ring factor EnvC (AmiA/AmiB activator)
MTAKRTATNSLSRRWVRSIFVKGQDMEESSAPVRARQSALPWVIVALLVFAAGISLFWMNNKIEALEAAKAPAQALNGDETRRAVAALQQRLNDIQGGQAKLTDQVSELQRRIAAEQGERKLLFDQLGSISQRVDALSSSSADANASPQQPQQNRRSRR